MAAAAKVDDELTLRRAQRGDERAWRDLIGTYTKPVHALLWRMFAGHARDRVEDLTQETFVRVLKALPAFDPKGTASLKTWILTIATRLALNELRRPPPEAMPEHVVGHARAPHVARSIEQAIASLPADQRAVIVLREVYGLEYDELAEALELPLNTVKSRLSRAREALREKLE